MKAFFKNLFLSARPLAVLCALVVSGLGSVMAQTTLTGKVTDAAGKPLAGVTVMVVGTTNGTMTNDNGAYSLMVENGDDLEFSCLGMTSVRQKYDGRAVLNVSMTEDNLFLDEVVVAGYGAMSKASLTGSVSQVQGSEILKGPATNVSSVLAGKLTGVSSVQESGQPGQDKASLRIRGSLYDVKYIVDGIPRDIIDDIDPNEIESISILKDAAAAAVYGLGGAGGVIIVTTKSGEAGATNITYTGSAGVSMNANYPEFLDGPGYAYYYNRALELDGREPVFSQEDVQSMIDGTNGFGNTDWTKETFGTGVNTQHNISVSGGTEKVRYFASLGYLHQKGNVDNFNYTRYNARVNLDANIAKNLIFKFGVAGQIGDQRSPGLQAGGSWNSDVLESAIPYYSIAEQAVYAHPYLPITYEGEYTGSPRSGTGTLYNPIAAINESGKYKTVRTNIQTTATLQWNLPWVRGLNLKFTGSYDKTFNANKNLSTPYYLLTSTTPSVLGNGTMTYGSLAVDPRSNTDIKLTEGLAQSQQMVGQASINFDRTFGKHDVKALALMEFTDYKYNNFGARGQGLAFVELPELGQMEGGDKNTIPIYGSSTQSRSVGFVARVNYAYDSRYLVELSGRYDGSYKFAGNVKGSRWGFFPSASVAWRISNEPFFEPAKSVLNDLKIRASFGEVGMDDVNAFSFLSRLGMISGQYAAIFGGSPVQGFQTSAVANPFLTWERQRSVNAGFDAIFWQRRLGIEFDAFYTYTYDILAATTGYPDSMGGYYPTYSNNNAIDNRGVEITISHDNRVGDFTYGAKFTLSWARAKYVKYADSYGTPSYQQVTGSLVNSDLVLVAEGLFQTEEEIDNSPWYDGKRPNLGDIKYKDVDGDGVIDAWKDRTYSGRSNRPELTGGLSLYGAWKGIDFSLMFTGGALFDVALTGIYYNGAMDSTPFTKIFKGDANAPVYLAEGSWTPENPNAEFPRLSISRSNDSNNVLASTFWYRDGKYIRLKTAQIGYTFPEKWMKVIGVQKLRIFVEGGNLFTLSGLPKGIDPEAPGVNLGYYPQQRTVLGGLSITF